MQEPDNEQNPALENLLVELRGIRLALEASIDIQKDTLRKLERTNKLTGVFNFIMFFLVGLLAAHVFMQA